jgi:hypothetical protein
MAGPRRMAGPGDAVMIGQGQGHALVCGSCLSMDFNNLRLQPAF